MVDTDFGGIATRLQPKEKEETVFDKKKEQRAEMRKKKQRMSAIDQRVYLERQ